MKHSATIIVFCLSGICLFAQCNNYKPVKGNHYKDLEDTVKKDSVQPAKRLNSEDTVRKY